MKEIRIHGRGGQGSVVTAELLAIAAFKDGKYSQAFPYLGGGGERRGAPVQAFCRIDEKPILLKCQVTEPNYLIVQDPGLIGLVDIFKGLKPNSLVLINSKESPESIGLTQTSFQIYSFPATSIALQVFNKPLMNTAMIGAFAVLCGDLNIEALKKAIEQKFPGETGIKNIEAMEKAVDMAYDQFGVIPK